MHCFKINYYNNNLLVVSIKYNAFNLVLIKSYYLNEDFFKLYYATIKYANFKVGWIYSQYRVFHGRFSVV